LPIITHEDELLLADTEDSLASDLENLAKEQGKVIKAQLKLADQISDMNIKRDSANRTFRDALKQMQVLLREQKSNVREEEVNHFEDIIRDNDKFIDASNKYLNAIKDLATRKKYYIDKIEEFAEALEEVADKRKDVVKKGLDVEKAKNKMIEGEKLQRIDQELNDVQREFDRARDVLIKKIEQFKEVRGEINDLWMELKNTTKELS